MRGAKFGRSSKARRNCIDGLGAPAQSLVSQAKIAQGFGIVRRQAESRLATADGPIQLAQCAISLGQIGVERGDVWPKRHGAADHLDGARVVPLLVVQHSQEVQRVGVRRFLRQDLLI